MQWYYSKNGTQLGPISQSELSSKLASGEVSPNDLVWKDGMGDWLPASQVAELRSAAPVSPPVSVAPAGTSATPYSPPGSSYSPPAAGTQEIPTYLWQSIVVTIMCCWPLGIPAIIHAAKVDGMKARGDIAGAQAASANAKKWTWIAFGSGLAVALIYLAFIVIGAASGNLQ